MITKQFISSLLLVPYYFIGLTLIVGISRFNSLVRTQHLLFILVCITAITEIASRILWSHKMNNLPLYHFYAVIEFLLLSSIYKRKLKIYNANKWMVYCMIIVVLFAVINAVFLQNLFEFNSNFLTVSSGCLIVFSILYFIQLLNEPKYYKLERNSMFWINAGVLVYFTSSMILFHVSNLLIPETLKVRGLAWGIHALFNVIHYISFSIALWVKPAN